MPGVSTTTRVTPFHPNSASLSSAYIDNYSEMFHIQDEFVHLTISKEAPFRVVAYYGEETGVPFTEDMASHLTHVIYIPGNDLPSDIKSGKKDEKFSQFTKVACGRKELKTLISFRVNDVFLTFVTRAYVKSLCEKLVENGFDGIDIMCIDTSPDVSLSINLFLRELKQELTRKQFELQQDEPFIVSMGVPPGIEVAKTRFDLVEVAKYVDFFNIIATTAVKYSQKVVTHPPVPLSSDMLKYSMTDSIKFYAESIGGFYKLNICVPLFGYCWTQIDTSIESDVMFQKLQSGANNQKYYRVVPYRDITANFGVIEAKLHEETKSQYVSMPEVNSLFAFEDEKSLPYKIQCAKDYKLGGVFMWSLEFDDDKLTLLNAVSECCKQ